MAKIVRVHDPSERQRRLPLVVQEDVCPGLLEYLSTLQYGHETPLIRGIVYQWFLHHKDAGSLRDAAAAVLAGPGGVQVRARAVRSVRQVSSPAPAADEAPTGTGIRACGPVVAVATANIAPEAGHDASSPAESCDGPSVEQIELLSSLDAIFEP